MSTTLFWLRISTISDWAIGTGKGRYGGLDSTIARDADGLPYIPASTLKGMLRDAAEQTALALGDGKTGAWTSFVDSLFGSQPVIDAQDARTHYDAPTGGLLRFGAAQLGVMPDGGASKLRRHLSASGPGGRRLRQALSVVKPGVAIDRLSGTAQSDMLRFDEVARQGLTLVARIDLAATGRYAKSAAAFLQAACFLMDRIGSKRRRGLGQIEAVLLEKARTVGTNVAKLRKDASQVLRHIKSQALQPPADVGSATPPVGAVSNVSGDVIILRATYMLLAPVLAATSVEGNVVLSTDYLPGSMLLPAVKRVLVSKTGKTLDAAIADNRFSVSPALPTLDGTAGLAAPACFERLKTIPADAADDRLFNVLDDDTTQTKQQKRGLGGGYLRIDGNCAGPIKVSRSLFTHNSIVDETQRPDASIGGVYVYEAIAAGTEFRGHVRLPADIAKDAIGSYDISLGRAKTAGYGAIRLTLEAAEPDSSNLAKVKSKTIRLYLGSDAICHGIFGQPEASAEALARAIAEAAGLEPATVKVDKAVIKSKTIQSWSVAAGLPRPTIVAIAAGSVACVDFADVEGAQAFAAAVTKGIGERRAEGFGQVLINPSWLMKEARLFMVEDKKEESQSTETLTALEEKDPDYEIGRLVEDKAWRVYVVEAIEALVADDKMFRDMFGFACGSRSEAPTSSQLGGLRSAILAVTVKTRREVVKSFLMRRKQSSRATGDSVPQAPSADMRDKFGERVADALWKIAETPGCILKSLETALPGPPACIVSRNADEAFDKISDFAVSALLLAGIQMHGRRLEKNKPYEDAA